MKAIVQRYATRVDAMSMRERVLVLGMVIVVIVTLANLLLLDPLFARKKALTDELANARTELQANQDLIAALTRNAAADPDAPARAKLQALQGRLAESGASLDTLGRTLVPADQIPVLLERILQRQTGLTLRSMRTLPVATLDPAKRTAHDESAASALPPTSAAGIYRHGIEITVEGSYRDLLSYVEQLEQLPWTMYWGRLGLKAENYPISAMTLTLYTVSLDSAWLSMGKGGTP